MGVFELPLAKAFSSLGAQLDALYLSARPERRCPDSASPSPPLMNLQLYVSPHPRPARALGLSVLPG